jgi:CheY-like chemotaxis protein
MLGCMDCRTVLVVGQDHDYLDEVAEALADIDAFGVLVEDTEGAAQALEEGFVPELILMDPLLAGASGGEEFLLFLRTAPQLETVPVRALSTPAPPGKAERRSRRRVDRIALLGVLQKLDGDRPSAPL